MKKFAVIVAGGAGTRMGNSLPKQFILLNGKPVLYYTLNTFLKSFADLQVILVLPEQYIHTGREISDKLPGKERIRITAGGETRFQSVKSGLLLAEEDAVIFVHDGVRCLVSADLIHRCYNTAIEKGTAIPAITSKDSVRLLTEHGNDAVDRKTVMLVQTPQTFLGHILLPAFNLDYKEEFTDEATVAEAHGIKITLIEGEENNIKITRPADIAVAEKILSEMSAVH
jgi:2-C-methyl-D-erythritol 4-phosphate cytidylyltransferase